MGINNLSAIQVKDVQFFELLGLFEQKTLLQ